MPLDLDRLRALAPEARDAELREATDADPDLKERLRQAYQFWHVPFRKRVVAEFQAEVPGITADDVEALMESWGRVFGGR